MSPPPQALSQQDNIYQRCHRQKRDAHAEKGRCYRYNLCKPHNQSGTYKLQPHNNKRNKYQQRHMHQYLQSYSSSLPQPHPQPSAWSSSSRILHFASLMSPRIFARSSLPDCGVTSIAIAAPTTAPPSAEIKQIVECFITYHNLRCSETSSTKLKPKMQQPIIFCTFAI